MKVYLICSTMYKADLGKHYHHSEPILFKYRLSTPTALYASQSNPQDSDKHATPDLYAFVRYPDAAQDQPKVSYAHHLSSDQSPPETCVFRHHE